MNKEMTGQESLDQLQHDLDLKELRAILEAMWDSHENAATYCGFSRASFDNFAEKIEKLCKGK